MTHQQIQRSPHWVLRWFANAAIAYPVVAIGLVYAEWLLAWHLIGHKPQWSVDDPKDIDGSAWLHLINEILLYGLVLAGIAAVIVNAAYIICRRPSASQAGIRALTLAAFWLGVFVWANNDPHGIFEWWSD